MIQHLSNRAIFRVRGTDAERYLNGQVSQDVRLATEDTAVYSIVANFKGKMEGDCYLRRFEGDILIDTSSIQRDSLLARLDKYLIADDAEIEDVSESYQLYHSIENNGHEYPSWSCDRYGVEGVDFLLPSNKSLPDCEDEMKWEQLRIANKIPIWGNELDETTLPPEADLEEKAISYAKGCYTGQEVISRMKSAGKKNRHLVGYQFDRGIPTPLPLKLYAEITADGTPETTPETKRETKPAAIITSTCENSDSECAWIGLGYRTRKHQDLEIFYDSMGNRYSIV